MTSGLISPLISSQLTSTISTLRERISETSMEAVTGRHSDLSKHLNGRIGDAMLGQKALDDITRETSQLDLRMSRLELTNQSLETIQDAGSGLGIEVLGAITVGNTERIELGGKNAKNALDKIFSALNSRHGQRQLFSGDATATGPVSPPEDLLADLRAILNTATDAADFQTSIDDYFDSATGGWQTTIYNGTATSSDPDAVLAIDPAITEMVKGLATLALADGAVSHPLFTGNSDVLMTAAQTITSASDSMIDLRVTVGNRQEQIVTRQNTLVAETSILSEAFNKMTGRDQYEAASELTLLETSLEASYLLTSRLSNLSLVNYLR